MWVERIVSTGGRPAEGILFRGKDAKVQIPRGCTLGAVGFAFGQDGVTVSAVSEMARSAGVLVGMTIASVDGQAVRSALDADEKLSLGPRPPPAPHRQECDTPTSVIDAVRELGKRLVLRDDYYKGRLADDERAAEQLRHLLAEKDAALGRALWELRVPASAAPRRGACVSRSCAVCQLDRELRELSGLLRLSGAEEAHRQHLGRRVARTLADGLPGVSAIPYGSWPSGVPLPDSDLDFCLTGEVAWSEEFTKAVRDCMEHMQFTHKHTVPVTRTAVPVVTFTWGRMEVDLSLAQPDAVLASVAATKGLLSQHEELRALAVMMKLFLLLAGLNKKYTGGLPSYPTVLMAAAVCSRSKGRGRVELLSRFLQMYGCNNGFEPSMQTVDPLTPDGVSEGLMVRGSGKEWCVRDPANPQNNVCYGCWDMAKVQQFFKAASERLDVVLGNSYPDVGQGRRLPLLSYVLGTDGDKLEGWVASRDKQLRAGTSGCTAALNAAAAPFASSSAGGNASAGDFTE
eukprot:TRINITY_DN7488_c0_g3_i1.p1 TRINITY_DN7488_c0_g3~~TRINITY_DN7488_c0_g3_i1.p1  ORF type:complete len:515 (+),score=98.18 TRINITY_DN7488_c0_g3_i1:715-2259(+)